MKHHVHPECYDERDSLEHREALLHTEKWMCEAQACTYADHYPEFQKQYELKAKWLKLEMKNPVRPSHTDYAIETVTVYQGRGTTYVPTGEGGEYSCHWHCPHQHVEREQAEACGRRMGVRIDRIIKQLVKEHGNPRTDPAAAKRIVDQFDTAIAAAGPGSDKDD